MFDGIKAIDSLAKTKLLDKNSSHRFNASLPILLKVLAKTKGDTYLLQLGNATITTKSAIALKINGIYWANMQKNAAGQIVLNNLVPKPEFMQNLKSSFLEFKDLQKLTQNPKNFIEDFKDLLLQKLATTNNKEEFKELSSMLFSLQHSVLSLTINDNKKQYLIQMRPKSKSKTLEFYAIFPHLGAIDGQILYEQNNKKPNIQATINVMNQYVQNLLNSYASKLKLESVTITCAHTPKPLFDFSHSLLDVKG